MNKYEQLIEAIIAENETKAKEIFHQIVVEKSRDIYESLLESEEIEDLEDEVEDDEVAESIRNVVTATEAKQLMDFIDGGLVESVNPVLLKKVSAFYGVGINEGLMNALEADSDELLDVAYGDDEGAADFDTDPSSDMDTDDGEFGDDMDGMDDMGGDDDSDLEGEVMDLRDELDELRAQFDELLAAESGEEEHAGEDFGGDEGGESEEDEEDEGGEDEGGEDEGGEEQPKFESKSRDHVDIMREYVEKVTAGHGVEKKGAGEGSEVGTGGSASINKQSTVAKPNKMGGTAANIVKGGAEQDPNGQAPKGKASGFVKPAKQIDVAAKNVNKVGGNAGAQDFYGTKAAAKKGEGQTTNGSVPVKKDSLESGGK